MALLFVRYASLALLGGLAVACGGSRGRTQPCERDSDCSPTQTCVGGRCLEAEAQACGGSTCTPWQRCLFDACFDGDCPDEACSESQVCENGQCVESSCVGNRCAAGPCDAVSCPTGCCDGATCVPHAAQGSTRCGTSGLACTSCPGTQTCAPTTHDCCQPSCAGQCAGASDGCGGFCATNQCSACCEATVCRPLCSGACCGDGQGCVGESMCCAANNEPVAAIPLQHGVWSGTPYTINADATHYFTFDLAVLSDVTVTLDDVGGAADLNVLVKGGFVPTQAEYDGTLAPPYTGNGNACLWYAFLSAGSDETVALTAVPPARYYVLVHNAAGPADTFRLRYVATPR